MQVNRLDLTSTAPSCDVYFDVLYVVTVISLHILIHVLMSAQLSPCTYWCLADKSWRQMYDMTLNTGWEIYLTFILPLLIYTWTSAAVVQVVNCEWKEFSYCLCTFKVCAYAVLLFSRKYDLLGHHSLMRNLLIHWIIYKLFCIFVLLVLSVFL